MSPEEYESKTGLRAYSKNQEYKRTIELFGQIYKNKGLYFALALLYDSQYGNKDLKGMLEVLKPGKSRVIKIKNKEI